MAGHYPFSVLRLHRQLRLLGPHWYHTVRHGAIISRRLV
jgi:hypothetical protein